MSTEGHDEISNEQRELSRRRFLRNAGLAASLPLIGGVVEILSEQGAGASTYKRNNEHPFFAKHPKYHFVMVNHVTTNSFFTATQYGIHDAANLLGVSTQWTGSTNSVVSQMVSAMDSAIAANANGIGVCLIDNTAFNAPVDTALSTGIPVVSYNADVEAGFVNNRMAYIGQSNLTAGAAVATHILKHVKHGDKVAGIIATPGTANIQPRINGAKPVFKKAGIHFVEVGTSATEGSPEYNKIQSWYAGNKDVKFMMAVDSGDSDADRGVHHQQPPEGQGWLCGLGCRHPGDRRRRKRHHDPYDRPAGLPAGFPADRAAVPLQHLRRADEAPEHRHRHGDRDQGPRRTV